MNKIYSVTTFIFFITLISAQEKVNHGNLKLDKIKEEIWSLEEAYISFFKEANHKEILSLWHSKILAWPNSESRPAGKEDGAIFLSIKYSSPSKAIFKINRKGIRVFGDIVITHYLLISSWRDDDGTEQKSESRITHTWIKENSQWKIFGGMSAKN